MLVRPRSARLWRASLSLSCLLSVAACVDKDGAMPTQAPTPTTASVPADTPIGEAEVAGTKRARITVRGFVGQWTPDLNRVRQQPAFDALSARQKAAALAMIDDITFEFAEGGGLRVQSAGVTRVGTYTVTSTSPSAVQLQTRTGDGDAQRVETLQLTLNPDDDDQMRVQSAGGTLHLRRAR